MDYRQDDFVASTLRELQQRAGVISLQPQHVSNTFWALASRRFTHVLAQKHAGII